MPGRPMVHRAGPASASRSEDLALFRSSLSGLDAARRPGRPRRNVDDRVGPIEVPACTPFERRAGVEGESSAPGDPARGKAAHAVGRSGAPTGQGGKAHGQPPPGAWLADAASRAALGLDKPPRRSDARFCSPGCKQSAYRIAPRHHVGRPVVRPPGGSCSGGRAIGRTRP
jgi:hypothetical protein